MFTNSKGIEKTKSILWYRFLIHDHDYENSAITWLVVIDYNYVIEKYRWVSFEQSVDQQYIEYINHGYLPSK